MKRKLPDITELSPADRKILAARIRLGEVYPDYETLRDEQYGWFLHLPSNQYCKEILNIASCQVEPTMHGNPGRTAYRYLDGSRVDEPYLWGTVILKYLERP